MKMKLNFLALVISASLSMGISGFAFGEEESGDEKALSELNEKEKSMVELNTLSFRANELKELYASTVIMDNVRTDRSYMLEDPITMREAINFNHPYLKTSVEDLTMVDREAIIESIKTKEQAEQRYYAIMTVALKFGTQAAYYEKTRNFHSKLLNTHYHALTEVFPFYLLTLEGGNIKPPLIEEVGYTQQIESKRSRRAIKKRYRIARQAEVVLKPQTFMDFFDNLLTDKPTPPNIFMLPINEEELQYWRKGILNGWLEGARLANETIRDDLRTLLREYIGQVRFHVLADANIISRPTSQNINIGTNDNGYSINIGEEIFEITELPRFNDDEMNWIALPQVDDIFDELTKEDVESLSDTLFHPGDAR